MHLKEIQLEHFKSFGRKVRVPLLPGYTAITGPNGGGKSNLSDAVLFVLGPRSNRVIRAGKLTDLIYNGGKAGKPAQSCSVSLLLDNHDRTLALDADEVKLTRVVRLSPQAEGGYNSYYYINDRRASLGEFDALLLHSGISAEGYNIVQQGDVGRIVSMGPMERRRVLDEVAGIARFDEEIARAEGERTKVEENLGRLDIILEEIGRGLRQLEKDRGTALRFKEHKEGLDLARAQLAHRNREVILAQVAATHEQIAKYEAERSRLEEQRARLKANSQAALQRQQELEGSIVEAGGSEARELKERVDALRIQRARDEDAAQRAQEDAKRLRLEEAATRKDLERVTGEVEGVKTSLDTAKTQLEDASADLKGRVQEVEALEMEAREKDSAVAKLQKDIADMTRRMDQVSAKHRQLSLEEDRHAQALGTLTASLAQFEELLSAGRFEVEEAEFQIKEMEAAHRGAGKSLHQLRGELQDLQGEEAQLLRQAQELEAAVRSLGREYEKLKAEAEAAEAVKRGYTRAVEAVLEARDRGVLRGIHGTVAELATVDPQYEIALLVAAGPRMQAIVVDDDGVAAEAIALLKGGRRGRATFLPLNKMLPGHPRGKALLVARQALGFAIDLVQFREEYRAAFWFVFGDTLVVKDLDDARRLMGGVRLVTLDGQLVEASGAMVGGEVEPGQLRFGLPPRGRLDEAAEKLRRATAESDRLSSRLSETKGRIVELETRLREGSGSSEAARARVEALQARRREFLAKVKKTEEDKEALGRQVAETSALLTKVQGDRRKIETQLATLGKEMEDRRAQVVAHTPQALASRIKEAQAGRWRASERSQGLQANVGSLEAQLKLAAERQEELASRATSLASRREDLLSRAQALQGGLGKLEEELRALLRIEESLGAKTAQLRQARDEAFQARGRAEAELDKLAHRMETREDFLVGLRTELKAQEEALKNAEEETRGRELSVVDELPTLEALRATIARCEAAMAALGAVNMRALEDYEEQARRRTELSAEVTRLRGERKDLLALVQELTSRKREGLLKVHAAINQNFSEVYREISEGGDAELVLEDPEDPLQGGLIMRVTPPNNRVQRLEALSGGEKGLASMAFIFALQLYDPSPFYLLDEVDQNLDAVNAERVARMVLRHSAQAQFLQVSLRKVTLKEADHLVGVVKTPEGTSQVIMRVDLEALPTEEGGSPGEVTA